MQFPDQKQKAESIQTTYKILNIKNLSDCIKLSVRVLRGAVWMQKRGKCKRKRTSTTAVATSKNTKQIMPDYLAK